ncbi:MAG: acyl transferase [Bacteroidia bacterium]|nr:acyl transferase [Bacteroidia bacterium]
MNVPDDFLSVRDEHSFRRLALELFRYQAATVPVYREYLAALGKDPASVHDWEEIPYLPVELFKTRDIIAGGKKAERIFSSSRTTGQSPSRHLLADVSLYERSFRSCFERIYGDVSRYAVLVLLPSYLEREGSSLVYMAEDLVRRSGHPRSGFYLHQYAELQGLLLQLQEEGTPVLLLGVTFALLDLAEQFPVCFPELMVMETGGMKGRRKEMIREELHDLLCRAFGVQRIHSEYGMTELLSQAYSTGQGLYQAPPWMRVRIREVNDPFSYLPAGAIGGLCITDLANVHSCAFLATQDLGRVQEDGRFEVLGRFDHAEARGCNLLVL